MATKVAFVGKVERVSEFEVTAFWARSYTWRYGSVPKETKRVYTFRSPTGEAYTWFTTTCPEGVEEGAEVEVTATFKKAEEFRGEARTVVTRAKVTVKTPAPTAEAA